MKENERQFEKKKRKMKRTMKQAKRRRKKKKKRASKGYPPRRAEKLNFLQKVLVWKS